MREDTNEYAFSNRSRGSRLRQGFGGWRPVNDGMRDARPTIRRGHGEMQEDRRRGYRRYSYGAIPTRQASRPTIRTEHGDRTALSARGYRGRKAHTPPFLPNEASCNVEEIVFMCHEENGLRRLQKNDNWLRFFPVGREGHGTRRQSGAATGGEGSQEHVYLQNEPDWFGVFGGKRANAG
jgi:hypothetical protein